MTSKRIRYLVVVLLILTAAASFWGGRLSVGNAAAPPDPGSPADPLVAKSYVDSKIAGLVDVGPPPDGSVLIIARADILADAMAAAPLALKENAILLFTEPGALPEATENALALLKGKTTKVYLLGSNLAISPSVEQRIKSVLPETGDVTYQRLQGANRYETAVRISEEVTSLSLTQ